MFNPIITVTLKPSKGDQSANVDLTFSDKVDGTPDTVRDDAWSLSHHTEQPCGSIDELCLESALAVAQMLNKGFAMHAELNAVAESVTITPEAGLFQPAFDAELAPDVVPSEVSDFENLEADAKAVSQKLEKALALITALRAPNRSVCTMCDGESAIFPQHECTLCNRYGYLQKVEDPPALAPTKKRKKSK